MLRKILGLEELFCDWLKDKQKVGIPIAIWRKKVDVLGLNGLSSSAGSATYLSIFFNFLSFSKIVFANGILTS